MTTQRVDPPKLATNRSVLVLSHCIATNRVFSDYCSGIQSCAHEYHYVDYIRQYLADGKDLFEKRIEGLVREKKIDCIFLIWWSTDLTFDFQFVARLASLAVLVINYFDTEFFFEPVDRYYAQQADLVLLTDSLSRYKYEQLGIEAMTTFAMYDSRAYGNKARVEKTIDVSFVGNVKLADRRDYIAYLKANGIAVTTFGVGSERGFVSFDEMVDIFNSSKINLSFTSIADVRNYVVKPPLVSQRIKQPKGRIVEIALCGGLVLTEHAAGIEQIFSVGEEIDSFRTKEELLAKVRYYLERDRERAEIAANGHRRAVNHYDVRAGFREVFKKLDEVPRPPVRTSYLDEAFLDNYVAFRFFYIALFLLHLKPQALWAECREVLKHRKLPLQKSFYSAIKGVVHFMREHPRIEARLKRLKNILNVQLQY